MSNNEEKNEASATDAPAGAPAPANPEPEVPSIPPAPNAATAADSRSTSRFYSRLRRGVVTPGGKTEGTAQLFTEGMTADQAVNLRDNLPVRATIGDQAQVEDEPRRGRERERDRERRFDRERGESPRGGRGRGRERHRDRERERERGERDRDRPRDEHTPPTDPTDSGAPVDTGDEWKGSTTPGNRPASPAPAENTAAEPAPTANNSRRVRFEDASPEASSRSVQEFRPSRDRSYAAEAERARREQAEARNDVEGGKPSGLFGWMKSIFGNKPEDAPAAPARPSGRPERGPRPGPGSNRSPRPGQQPRGEGAGGDFPGGKRRRRRRRGGRNRHREGGPGGAPRPSSER